MTTVPMSMVEAVARAVERLSRPGIEGWGLRVDSEMAAAGELLDLGPHDGCTSETCAHVSHDPAAPERRWVPLSGRLIELGSDLEPGEVIVRWFAHLDDDGKEVRYIRLEAPRFYHAEATYVDVEGVPEWALARLAEEAAV